ncbi:MAG: hypothetical protein H0W83_14455 [Planctomycetes bacterium]|nr:hypothetical protein [Planctomycetota bacterium]
MTVLLILASLTTAADAPPPEVLQRGKAVPEAGLTLEIVPTAAKEGAVLSGDVVTVQLTNHASIKRQVWSESCSWGYAQLSFEVMDPAGAIIVVRKIDHGEWRKNVPSVLTLGPEKSCTLTAVVTEPTQWQPVLANTAPGTTTRLRAVFASPAYDDPPIADVWSGRVESPWLSATINLSQPMIRGKEPSPAPAPSRPLVPHAPDQSQSPMPLRK